MLTQGLMQNWSSSWDKNKSSERSMEVKLLPFLEIITVTDLPPIFWSPINVDTLFLPGVLGETLKKGYFWVLQSRRPLPPSGDCGNYHFLFGGKFLWKNNCVLDTRFEGFWME